MTYLNIGLVKEVERHRKNDDAMGNALEAEDNEADNGKALCPKEGNPVAERAKRGGQRHRVSKRRQGKDKPTAKCDISKLSLHPTR